MTKKEIDFERKYGRLKILREVEPRVEPYGNKVRRVECVCDCGTIKAYDLCHLRNGATKSCGCLSRERAANSFKHMSEAQKAAGRKNASQAIKEKSQKTWQEKLQATGLQKDEYIRLKGIWNNIRKRCYYEKSDSFKYYGQKGISICSEWETFEGFAKWAKESGYSDGLSIDRINNDDDYRPENCRWVTALEQANNTSRNVKLKSRESGEEKTLREWADEFGVEVKLIRNRYQRLKGKQDVTIEDIIDIAPRRVEIFWENQWQKISDVTEVTGMSKGTVWNIGKRNGLLRWT